MSRHRSQCCISFELGRNVLFILMEIILPSFQCYAGYVSWMCNLNISASAGDQLNSFPPRSPDPQMPNSHFLLFHLFIFALWVGWTKMVYTWKRRPTFVQDNLHAWLWKAVDLLQSPAIQFLEVRPMHIVYFCLRKKQKTKQRLPSPLTQHPLWARQRATWHWSSAKTHPSLPLLLFISSPCALSNAFLLASLFEAKLRDAAETPSVRAHTMLSDKRTLAPCDVAKETCLLQHIGLFV